MKLLIGAACIAIIAFVGYYFWNEYKDTQARAIAAQAQALELFQNDCSRLISNDPKYDAAFVSSLSPSDLDKKQIDCINYSKTGKLP